jgi:acyl carrier protein
MPLSPAVLKHLHDRARAISVPDPGPDDNLYNCGILDSFEFMRLIAVLETEYHIDIAGCTVPQEHFQTVRAIEGYIDAETSK